VKDKVELKIHAVKQTGPDGVERTLHGWLHIELQLLDPTDELRIVYLQMKDQYFNAIGEFVMDPEEDCANNDASLFVSPPVYQFLLGLRNSTNSPAVYMVHSDIWMKYVKDPANDFVPEWSFKKGFHATWRFGEYWCNRHLLIRPE